MEANSWPIALDETITPLEHLSATQWSWSSCILDNNIYTWTEWWSWQLYRTVKHEKCRWPSAVLLAAPAINSEILVWWSKASCCYTDDCSKSLGEVLALWIVSTYFSPRLSLRIDYERDYQGFDYSQIECIISSAGFYRLTRSERSLKPRLFDWVVSSWNILTT